MDLEHRKIIKKPFNLDILTFCNGEYNILEITEKVGLSYKTIFLRIKELEKFGIVEIQKGAIYQEGSKINLSPNYEEEIKEEIMIYETSGLRPLQDLLKDKDKKQQIFNFLSLIKKNRFIGREEVLGFINENKNTRDLGVIRNILSCSGLIRERLEITKKGIRFLKTLEEDLKK